MKAQERTLSLRMSGEDVALLQMQLGQLGFRITDREGYFGKTTHQAVLQFQRQHALPETGKVDASFRPKLEAELDGVPGIIPGGPTPPEPPVPSHSVIGRVLRTDGPPVTGVEVQALHKNLRSEIFLGKQYTDDKGFYTIRYDPPEGVDDIDLVMRVINVQTDQEIARSALVCDARRVQLDFGHFVIAGGRGIR